MMVEGGNIDHSLHSNDAATAIIETLEFDKTLTYALDFYRQHPDETLIIVTADHNTGGISIGDNTTRYNAYSQLLSHSRISKDALSDLCEQLLRDNALTSWDDARQLLSDKLGLFTEVELSAEQEQQLHEIFQRVFIDKKRNDQTTLYSRINEFAAVAVDMLNQQAGFGWTTLAHTGDTVPVFAIGVGAELFGSWNDNIDIPAKILRIAELEK
jgi:alkaline phosphatase